MKGPSSRRAAGCLADGSLVMKQPRLLHSYRNHADMIVSRTVRGLNLIVSDPRVLSLSVPVHKEQAARVVVDGSDQSVLQPASPSPEPTKIRPSDFEILQGQLPNQPLKNRQQHHVRRSVGYQRQL